ncbi:MAG: hypothetical protein BWY47_01546 [Bacteroidetes bacterium ADurb.Bin302]|nr:MAG: hypothetical protein BWY47_01546 [Bacteroidetes bacterium ADurb.Bin302]
MINPTGYAMINTFTYSIKEIDAVGYNIPVIVTADKLIIKPIT